MTKQIRASFFSWVQIIVGLFLCACAYRMYLIPNEIAPGGFAGIGQMANKFVGWPVGLVTLLLNVPLFALAIRSMGVRFSIKSLAAMVLFSLMIDHMGFIGVVEADPMLSSIFGGAMSGIGFGLILRGGASTGGTDMLSAIVNRRFPVLRISMITLAFDALVIIASGFVFSPKSAMLALIAAYLCSQLLDMVLEGPNLARAYYIISDNTEGIADRIMKELERGCTALKGVGMYSGDERMVLMCVINRMETMRLRNIVSELDPNAFMIATNVYEALGEGFKEHL